MAEALPQDAAALQALLEVPVNAAIAKLEIKQPRQNSPNKHRAASSTVANRSADTPTQKRNAAANNKTTRSDWNPSQFAWKEELPHKGLGDEAANRVDGTLLKWEVIRKQAPYQIL
jgi:hypothetical protein